MVPMMSAMRAEALRISSIVLATSDITVPPSAAVPALRRATSAAVAIRPEPLVTVVEIWSIDAADCARLLAAASVRVERSCAPCATSSLDCTMRSLMRAPAPPRWDSESCMVLRSFSNQAASSLPQARGRWVRSPWAMALR